MKVLMQSVTLSSSFDTSRKSTFTARQWNWIRVARFKFLRNLQMKFDKLYTQSEITYLIVPRYKFLNSKHVDSERVNTVISCPRK